MSPKLIECTDKEQWDRFAAESPHGSVFCQTPFLDALGKEYRLLLVENKDGPQVDRKTGQLDYTGMGRVPEMIVYAAKNLPADATANKVWDGERNARRQGRQVVHAPISSFGRIFCNLLWRQASNKKWASA